MAEVSPSNNSFWQVIIPKIYLISLPDQKENGNIRLNFISEGKFEYNRSLVDQIMTNIVSEQVKFPPTFPGHLKYFISCYARANEIRKQRDHPDLMHANILEYIMSQLVSYIGLMILYPESFIAEGEVVGARLFVTYMVSSENIVSESLIDRLVDRFKDQGLKEIFEPIFDELKTLCLSNTSLNMAINHLKALKNLVNNKVLASMLVNLPHWIPNIRKHAKEIEAASILGPFFRITTIHGQVIPDSELMGDFESITSENIDQLIERGTNLFSTIQNLQYEVLHCLLISSHENRVKVLEWIGNIIHRNKDRMKQNADYATISSAGFLLNVIISLLRLCKPILNSLDPNSTVKIGSIDPSYLVSGERGLGNLTAINMPDSELAAYRKSLATKESKPNFVTECFFATMHLFQLGMMNLLNQVDLETRPELESLSNLNSTLRNKIAILNPSFILVSYQYWNFVANWILRIANQNAWDQPKFDLPLPAEASKEYSALPEYAFENVIEFFNFLTGSANGGRDTPYPLVSYDTILTFYTTFIASPKYITNPHLWIKFVEGLLSFALLGRKNKKEKKQGDPFDSCSFAQKYLGRALIHFYVDVEITGVSSQFFDKFNARYYAQNIIRHVWKIPSYQASFDEAFSDSEYILKFGDMWMNDIIYLTDEAIEKLSKIREFEALQIGGELGHMEMTARNEKEQQNVQNERVARSYILLANETIRLFACITQRKASSFVREELIDRIAQMLSHTLLRIAGPKQKDIQVANPIKYKFDAKWFSKKVVEIYLHFSKSDKFVEAAARDNKSFEKNLYIDIAANLYRSKHITLEMHDEFTQFINLVASKMDLLTQEEADLGEIPDEFIDPILSLLMTDPIKLPSGITVDRQTITRHLLSQPNDPYNRQPLTIEELVPDTELKDKIDAFLASKRKS